MSKRTLVDQDYVRLFEDAGLHEISDALDDRWLAPGLTYMKLFAHLSTIQQSE